MNAVTEKWQVILEPQLRGLAMAHGLRYVDRSLAPEIWRERLLNQLGKSYQLP